MSFICDSINPFRSKPKPNNPQKNQLINNPNNNIIPYRNNNLSQSMRVSGNNHLDQINSGNNLYNSTNNISNSQVRRSSFDGKINENKVIPLKRNLSSSGVLKPSKRDKKFNKVLKNGKLLKNIDVNRDYEENPLNEDELSSSTNTNNMLKNRLSSISTNSNKLNNSTTKISTITNNSINQSNIQPNNNIKTIKNNLDETPNNSSPKKSEISNKLTNDSKTNNNKQEPIISKSQTQNILPKNSNALNLINPNPNIKSKLEGNSIYNVNLPKIPEIEPQLASPDTSIPISNLGEYIKNETLPQPLPINNNLKINPLARGKGFRYWCKLSKAGKDIEGHEKTNQDTPLVYINVGGIEGFNIFGVLDGHGPNGHFVSQYCKNYFITKMNQFVESLKLINPYLTVEDVYRNLKESDYSYILELFEHADTELSLQNTFEANLSGTTCNLIFQFNIHLLCFNVGDSRSILTSDSEDENNQILTVMSLSVDHKPDLPEELKRIQSMGGVIDQIEDYLGNKVGPLRVFKYGCPYPGLAMSRSLGDLQAKECGVISTPDIIEYDINKKTKYLVVCSDGIWEFISNEQVAQICEEFYYKNDVGGFCKQLINCAVNIWTEKGNTRDDITVVTVFF